MAEIESVKGPSVFERAMDEVTAIKETLSDSLHSITTETEAKVEHLKEDMQEIFGKAKEEIQHLVEAAVHPKKQGGEEGEASTPVEMSIPVLGENIASIAKEEMTTIAMKTTAVVKEKENSLLSFFARIIEKCCDFNKKED